MGWDEDKLSDVIGLLDGDIRSALYEMQNCIRGCYTGCNTYEELGEYLKQLGERLVMEADAVSCLEEDEEEDEEWEED